MAAKRRHDGSGRWYVEANAEQWVRSKPLRLPTAGALTAVVNALAPGADGHLILRASPTTFATSVHDVLEVQPDQLHSLTVGGGEVTLSLSSGRDAKTVLSTVAYPENSAALLRAAAAAVDAVGRDLRWWERRGSGVPVISASTATEERAARVQSRAAWIGGICGFLGGVVGGLVTRLF